jgi:uncharacterized protein YukE
VTTLHGNDQPVPFAFAEATALAKAFRTAADTFDQFADRRPGLTDAALRQWQGVFADSFRGDVSVGLNNARNIAHTLRAAAVTLDGLATDAHNEQTRRKKAQEWYQRHTHKNLGDQVHDLLFGEEKPPLPAVAGPTHVATAPPTQARSL